MTRNAVEPEGSSGCGIDASAWALAVAGILAPMLAGIAAGKPDIGLAIGLGALFLSGGDPAPGSRWRSAARSALVALLAIAASLAVVAMPWPDATLIALSFAAAMLSGYSRAVGAAAVRFTIYCVLCVTLLEGLGPGRWGAAAVFAAGALWNIAIRKLLNRGAAAAEHPARRLPTATQLLRNWLNGLRGPAGWQFGMRLAGGLTLACWLRDQWPAHHFGWIVLTTALLTERQVEPLSRKTAERGAGTLAGVGLAWLILTAAPRHEATVGLIAILASVALVARRPSYLAYSILSTPVTLLAMDFSHPVSAALLVDRLIATLAGAAIALIANRLVLRLLSSCGDDQKATRNPQHRD